MRSLARTFRQVRDLLGRERNWRWWLLVGLALLFSVMEAAGAAMVYLLVGMVASPTATVTVPGIGDLGALFPELDPVQLQLGLALFVAFFFVVRSMVFVVKAYVQERLTANAGVMLAHDLLRGYLAMPYVQHTQRSTAELIRNTYDSSQQFVGQALRPLVTLAADVVLAAGLLAVLILTAPLATLLAALVFIPSLWLLQARIQPRLKSLGRRAQEARTASIAAVQQSLGAIRDIKLLDRSDDFAAEHARERVKLARSQYLSRTIKEIPRALIETTLILTIVVVFAVAIVAGGAIDDVFATLGLFAYAGLRLQPALQRIVTSLNEIRFGAAVVDDLADDRRQLEDWRAEEQASRPHGPPPEPFHESLRLEGVSFSYTPDAESVLHDIDLAIRAGEFVGICGPTGGGKSTLVDALVGLLQPTRGRITVDGQPLGPRPHWWWQQLGVVSQQVFLTDDTLRANIAFGERAVEVEDDRLARCVRRAQLVSVVEGFPDGLDTVVGERGVRLSGGQRQRVAIARALYREPAVLVLDEGTSALDTATETALVAALDEAKTGRTLIAVAHRIATIRHADRILVVADGRVVADGDYDLLLETSEVFRALAG